MSPAPRSAAMRRTLAVCAGLVCAAFAALGSWQVQRLQWKLDLIERVGRRVHAAPVEAPGPGRWSQVQADTDAYRHVRLSGAFLYQYSTRVQAVTELGSGFWLLTPLCRADGSIVLVNRGFVPAAGGAASGAAAQNKGACRPGGGAGRDAAVVTGLLRISEPGGAFLRHNDPLRQRWYSRDVPAIARAQGISRVAPYFVDADRNQEAANGAPERPVGGLTVISFHNNHLVYAVTWYALALMVAGAFLWVARDERKLLRRNAEMPGERDKQDVKNDR